MENVYIVGIIVIGGALLIMGLVILLKNRLRNIRFSLGRNGVSADLSTATPEETEQAHPDSNGGTEIIIDESIHTDSPIDVPQNRTKVISKKSVLNRSGVFVRGATGGEEKKDE